MQVSKRPPWPMVWTYIYIQMYLYTWKNRFVVYSCFLISWALALGWPSSLIRCSGLFSETNICIYPLGYILPCMQIISRQILHNCIFYYSGRIEWKVWTHVPNSCNILHDIFYPSWLSLQMQNMWVALPFGELVTWWAILEGESDTISKLDLWSSIISLLKMIHVPRSKPSELLHPTRSRSTLIRHGAILDPWWHFQDFCNIS